MLCQVRRSRGRVYRKFGGLRDCGRIVGHGRACLDVWVVISSGSSPRGTRNKKKCTHIQAEVRRCQQSYKYTVYICIIRYRAYCSLIRRQGSRWKLVMVYLCNPGAGLVQHVHTYRQQSPALPRFSSVGVDSIGRSLSLIPLHTRHLSRNALLSKYYAGHLAQIRTSPQQPLELAKWSCGSRSCSLAATAQWHD